MTNKRIYTEKEQLNAIDLCEGMINKAIKENSWLNSNMSDMDDLRQELQMAVLHALEKYDESLNVPFKAYASKWIQAASGDFRAQNRYIVGMSKTVYNNKIKVRKAIDELTSNNELVTTEAIANKTGLSAKVVSEALVSLNNCSLNSSTNEDEDTPIDLVKTEYFDTTKDIDTYCKREAISEALHKVLDDVEYDIVVSLTGYYHEKKTQEELGRKYNVSHQRIAKIYSKGLEKMKGVLEEML